MQNLRKTAIQHDLVVIFAFAFLMRILFWLFIAPHLHPVSIYLHADTESFVAPAINLHAIGTYTSDVGFRDGLFTRVPGYALFLYLLQGLTENIHPWVAAVQVVIDSGTAVMIAVLAGRMAERRAGWLAGGIYAMYPFALFWVTLTVPDVVTTALAIAGLLIFARDRPPTWQQAAIDGAYLAAATLTREYLILLVIPAAVSWMTLNTIWSQRLKTAGVAGLVGLVVYSPWPARNFVVHEELIVFRAPSSGYRQYASDMGAAVDWMSAWTPTQGIYLDRVARNEPLDLPEHVLSDEESERAFKLFERSRECGVGIRLWGGRAEPVTSCNEELAQGYADLKQSYIQRHPVRWAFEVPLLNLHKSLFKNELMKPANQPGFAWLAGALFGARTVLLLIGFAGLWISRKRRESMVVAVFAMSVYLFMSFYIRGLQMRYLLQADVALIIPAGIALQYAVTLWSTRNRSSVEKH